MATHLYTPRVSTTSQDRIRMQLSDEDIRKTGHGKYWEATVTDTNTGKRYIVRAAACGLRCYCDAVIVSELGAPEEANTSVTSINADKTISPAEAL